MRWVWVGILAATALLGTSAYELLRLRGEANDKPWTLEQIREARLDFAHTVRPLFSLSLAELSPYPDLLQSETTLPQLHRYPIGDLQEISRFAETCAGRLGRRSDGLEKTRVWHRFLCGKRKLPANFFSRPPWLHPMGKSFPQLAFDSGLMEFRTSVWLESHQRFFHILELGKLPMVSPKSALLSQLDYELLDGANHREPFLQNAHLLGMTSVGSEKTMGDVIQFYDRASWDAHLRDRGFRTERFTEGKPCLLIEGRTCWMYHERRRWAENLSLAILLLSGLGLIGATAYLILDRQSTARRTREARHFLLQTLTHELRTPVTTLQLTVEGFRREFDSLSPEAQGKFLRLADEVQRLGRLVHASAKYLRSDTPDLRFEEQVLSSFQGTLETWLAPYGDRVRLAPVETDRALRVDPYWLNLCVINLVENALRHGRPPVWVTWEVSGKGIQLSVADDGEVNFGTLEALLAGARPQPAGEGLGLGLSIVKRVAEKMGGSLALVPRPTRFTLVLRNVLHAEAAIS